MEKGKIISIVLAFCMFVVGLLAGILGEEILEEEEEDGAGAGIIDLDDPYSPEIDPANFVVGVNNTYFPLTPGTTLVYEGETEDGTEHIEVFVTNETKTIMGVTCTVVRDTVSIGGELFEDTYDWFAQDIDGNVWYFGEDSKEYDEGEVTTAGSWEAGVDGAKPGIIMFAKPYVGVTYRQEYYKGEAEDMGTILSIGEEKTVRGVTYTDLLVIKDINPFELDVEEHKYYAPGVGVVLEEMVRGGDERVELIEIRTE